MIPKEKGAKISILVNAVIFLPPVAVFLLLATYNFFVYRTPRKLEKLKRPNPQGVSVYVPVYNDKNILGSLPLLAELDYPNFTIKILDDSTDEKLKKEIDLFVLSQHNFSVIRRLNRTGFKGGAIENALKDEMHPFICILDCDFRPPKDFLANIVSAIEYEHVDVLQGYQRHIRGSESFLGTFYRASSAGSILCLSGRDRLKLAPIFSGCCALISTDTAKRIGFAGESVTEDLNFSIRAYARGNFEVAVRHDVYADGSCPETFVDFVTQQLRWCEGTIRDIFRVNLLRIFRMKIIKQKADLLMQGLHFSSGFFMLWSLIASLLGQLPLVIGLFIAAYTGFGFAYPLLLGASLEKLSLKSRFEVLICGFVLIFVMCPIMTFGFLRGLIKAKGSFKVTLKH